MPYTINLSWLPAGLAIALIFGFANSGKSELLITAAGCIAVVLFFLGIDLFVLHLRSQEKKQRFLDRYIND